MGNRLLYCPYKIYPYRLFPDEFDGLSALATTHLKYVCPIYRQIATGGVIGVGCARLLLQQGAIGGIQPKFKRERLGHFHAHINVAVGRGVWGHVVACETVFGHCRYV